MTTRPPSHSGPFRIFPSRLVRSWLLATLLAALVACSARVVLAQNKDPTTSLTGRRFSNLEFERIKRALTRVRGKVDLNPKGKRIESIEIVALPVFEPEDLVPQFLNWFHVTTQNYVIERELLLHIGDHYDQRLSDETERNLQALILFSVVVALPLEGSTPNTIRYLVVTKDIWSLRLGWNGQFNKGVIDYLSVQPTERNLFGTGRQLYGTLEFTRRTYAIGLGFFEPRLAGSRTFIAANVQAILNCDSEIEGSAGSFQYSRPQYSTRTPWAYSTSVSWSNRRSPLRIPRNFGGAICSVRATDILRADMPSGRWGVIPNEYLFDSQAFTQSFTRSYGYRYKTDLRFGLEAIRYAYGPTSLSGIRPATAAETPDEEPSDDDMSEAPPEDEMQPEPSIDETPPELTDAERQYLINLYHSQLAPTDRRISPFFQLTSYTNDFHRDINSETLGLQETGFRTGHVASLRIFPALEALGSTRDMLGLTASASYARAVDTGYAKVSVVNDVELSRPEETDAALSLALRFTSPRFLLGRFVYDARLYEHYRNYRNGRVYLGGTNRLRGYANAAEEGFHYIVSNLEFRSRPLDIFTVQLAGVLFYDVGDAFYRHSDLEFRHGIGGGIRFLAPQIDRDVFRVDVGVPVPFDAPGGEVTFIATFGQAFGLP